MSNIWNSYNGKLQPTLNPYDLPGILGAMANDLGSSGVDPAIIGAQVSAFASLLTQGAIDVCWPNGDRIPAGSNTLLVAASGGGKSAVFKTLMGSISSFLEQHDETEYEQGITPEFLIEDATRESTVLHLSEWPIAGIFTDEAGMLKRLIKGGTATLAKLLDGSPLNHSRVSTGRISLRGHRLCMLLLEQPQVFQETKALLGASAGSVGLINRFHVFMADSLPVGSSLHKIGLSAQTENLYSTRVKDLLSITIKNVREGRKRHALRLSPVAEQYFINLRERVQQRLASNEQLNCIAEYASRHSERVLRLSASMHAFEQGIDSEIQLPTIQIAENFDHKSIECYLKMIYSPPKIPQSEQHAQLIYQELCKTYYTFGSTDFPLSMLRSSAPNIGLTKSQFDKALPILASRGAVTILAFHRGTGLRLNAAATLPYYANSQIRTITTRPNMALW